MTIPEFIKLFDKEYAKSLEFFKTEYERYDRNGKLPLPARRKLEALIKEMFDLFVENNVSMFSDDKPGTDIANVLIKFKAEGNPIPRDVMISTSSSCWMLLCLQKTDEEIKASAERHARLEVDFAIHREQEAERQKKEAEEEAKKVAEVKARLKAQEEDDWKKRDREIKEWTEKMRTRLDTMRKKQKFYFATTECSENQLKAIKEYVFQLHRFSDAMNNGLTGMGLYSFNDNRMTAHDNMLEAFDLQDNEFASSITKNYDFADDFDYVSRTYTHIDEDLSIDMLAYACKMAQTAPDIFH